MTCPSSPASPFLAQHTADRIEVFGIRGIRGIYGKRSLTPANTAGITEMLLVPGPVAPLLKTIQAP